MKTRDEGFYWVKYGEAWIPAHWTGGLSASWFLPGFTTDLSDQELDGIGERLYPPGSYLLDASGRRCGAERILQVA